MKQIDEYINHVFKHINGNSHEIKELKEEMRTHLLEAVNELQAGGRTCDESVLIAIKRFDENNQLNYEIKNIFHKHKYSLKKILTISLSIIIILIVSMYLLIGKNNWCSKNIVGLDNATTKEKSDFKVQKTLALNSDSVPSKVIIYNPHPYEKYTNNYETVDDISKKLADKLTAYNLSCEVIENQNLKREDAYTSIKEFIKKDVLNYSEKVIIDIHRDGVTENEVVNNGIAIIIAKGNNNYKLNEKFAKQLKENIEKLDKSVTTTIHLIDISSYNQELSSRAIRVQMGKLDTSSEILERDIEALTHALANLL